MEKLALGMAIMNIFYIALFFLIGYIQNLFNEQDVFLEKYRLGWVRLRNRHGISRDD